MSWSFQVPPTLGEDFEAAVETARNGAREQIERSNPHGQDQADAAVHAVKELYRSGVLGSLDKYYYASLSGHGNKDHEPDPNWATDQVYITVNQVREPAKTQ